MSGSEESGGGHLILETLIAIIILLFYTISAPLFEKYHFHYMHESGMCMIIGVIITFLSGFLSSNANFSHSLKFNDEIFFTFILPPIIFAAGYNLNRKSFFKYFMYIFVFGVVGTIITFSVVAPLTYLANKNNMFYFTFYDKDSFLDDHFKAMTYHSAPESSLPVVPEKTALSSHLMLNSYLLSEKNETLQVNGVSSSLPEEALVHGLRSDNVTSKDLSIKNKTNEKSTTKNSENNFYKDSVINFSVKDILLFSAVISATDTVAALTFIKEDKDPKLFAILFGEGVLNDAVCIVLYRIIKEFTDSNEEFTSGTPFMMINKFLSLFFYSFLVGTIVGISSSLFLKHFKYINLNRVQECSIIIFFAFISYTLAEELGLSPIISLLFTGMFMSHYTFYNLSFQAREESSTVSKMMSNIAEAFVFTYLGLTVLFYMTHALSISFIFWELLIVVLGRVIGIFGLSWFLIRVAKVKNFKLKLSEKGIMSCAGSIRGAIAFGLAISIDSKNRQIKEVLISSTLILVFLTTIVFGAIMPFAIKFFKSLDKEEGLIADAHDAHTPAHQEGEEQKLLDFSHPNFSKSSVGGHKETDIKKLKERLSYWLGTYWVDFDHVYMKPRLVYNWPEVKEENDELSSRILVLANDFKKELKERRKYRTDDDIYNYNRLGQVNSRENLTELRPMQTEEENWANLQKQIGQSANNQMNDSKRAGNLKESAHSNFSNNSMKNKNPKITFLEKQANTENSLKIDKKNDSVTPSKTDISNKSGNKNGEDLKLNKNDDFDNVENMFSNMNVRK